MTKSALVTNFLDQYRKPFDMETAAGMTGLSKKVVRPIVTRAKHKGQVKEIEPGIYIRIHHERISNSATGMPCGWKYSVTGGHGDFGAARAQEDQERSGPGHSPRQAVNMPTSIWRVWPAWAPQWDGSRYLPTGKGSVR